MHVEISEMSLDTAPRNVVELQHLSMEERAHLYVLLQEAEVLPPSSKLNDFEKLGLIEQSSVLLQALLDYDCNKEPTFSVIAIELPVRAGTRKLNQTRWREFGAEVEGALNRLEDAGLELETALKFEEHGMLIIGRKPQQERVPESFELPVPLSALIPALAQQHLGQQEPNENRDKMSEVAAAVSKVITSTSTEEDIRPAISSVVRTVSDIDSFRKYVQEEHDAHNKGCTTPGCPVRMMLKVVLEELDRRRKSLC